MKCNLIGAPVQTGASQAGCVMGPDALRTAGIENTLHALGHSVCDWGNVANRNENEVGHANAILKNLSQTASWIEVLSMKAYQSLNENRLPIFLGGDHSLSAGTVSGVTRFAREQGQEQFVLWLDAHPDIHTLETTRSGNLHGVPVAYFSGEAGFDGIFPDLYASVSPRNICMMGIRSVDQAERCFLSEKAFNVHDMRSLDETGVAAPLRAFLDKVAAANGALHVSLDVDFLDPAIAPAVGTTVPGGATFREAHLIMEILHDSGLVTSLDLVELNPFLDERGRTATLMVDLCASLFGKTVLDRPTRSYSVSETEMIL